MHPLNPFSGNAPWCTLLYHFTLSNTRWFYSSREGRVLPLNGLTTHTTKFSPYCLPKGSVPTKGNIYIKLSWLSLVFSLTSNQWALYISGIRPRVTSSARPLIALFLRALSRTSQHTWSDRPRRKNVRGLVLDIKFRDFWLHFLYIELTAPNRALPYSIKTKAINAPFPSDLRDPSLHNKENSWTLLKPTWSTQCKRYSNYFEVKLKMDKTFAWTFIYKESRNLIPNPNLSPNPVGCLALILA